MTDNGNIVIDKETNEKDIPKDKIYEMKSKKNVKPKSLYKEKGNFLKYVYWFIKRILDVILALIGLIFFIPITIIIFIIKVILKDKGPLFYIQFRVGKNYKVFKLFKYRTMVIDADKKLEEYLVQHEDAKEEFEIYQKLENDPRITKMGKFLRKTSLDELPQLFNILKGEMSFIGPRPVLIEEAERYGKDKSKFLSVKPGLTGYWQANGRSNTSYEERIKMELYYVDNCSLWLDIKIFFKTFITVIKKEGAM